MCFRYTDFVFGNETEAKTFSKVQGWEVTLVYQIFRQVVVLNIRMFNHYIY